MDCFLKGIYMFFNKNKKKNDDVQNRFLVNLDGWEFFDTQTGEFQTGYKKIEGKVSPVTGGDVLREVSFNAEQKKILRCLIDNKIPVGAIAYTGLPADYMREILNILLPNGSGENPTFRFSDEKMYQITHTDLTLNAFKCCLEGLKYDMYFCDEVDNIAQYPDTVFECLALGARENVNLSKYLAESSSVEDFYAEVKYRIRKNRSKRFHMSVFDRMIETPIID